MYCITLIVNFNWKNFFLMFNSSKKSTFHDSEILILKLGIKIKPVFIFCELLNFKGSNEVPTLRQSGRFYPLPIDHSAIPRTWELKHWFTNCHIRKHFSNKRRRILRSLSLILTGLCKNRFKFLNDGSDKNYSDSNIIYETIGWKRFYLVLKIKPSIFISWTLGIKDYP